MSILPYSDKRKQLLNITFLINKQNVSVIYIDINAISLYLDLNIFQQNECFCSKLRMEVEYAKSNLNITFSDLGDLSVASFCQSRAVFIYIIHVPSLQSLQLQHTDMAHMSNLESPVQTLQCNAVVTCTRREPRSHRRQFSWKWVRCGPCNSHIDPVTPT